VPGAGVLQRRAAGLDRLDHGFLQLAFHLVQRFALRDELRMLVGVGLHHLPDADAGGAGGRLGGGDVRVDADLRDVPDRPAFLLVAGDDLDQDLVLVDLLARLLAVPDEHRALRRQRVRVLGDREELLGLDQGVLLLVVAAHLVLEGLDLDAGFLDQRIGDHQAVVLAVFLDGFAEQPGDLAGEVAVGVGEVDVDDQRLPLGIDAALLGEDLLLGERAGEDVAGLIGLEHQLALGGGQALGDAFDDVGAAHRLDGGEEVVVGDDLEVVFDGRGAAVDRRSQAEDPQPTRGAVFRRRVVGVEQGQREEDQRREHHPPEPLAQHQQVAHERIGRVRPASLGSAVTSVAITLAAGPVAAVIPVGAVAAPTGAVGFGGPGFRRRFGCGHGKTQMRLSRT